MPPEAINQLSFSMKQACTLSGHTRRELSLMISQGKLTEKAGHLVVAKLSKYNRYWVTRKGMEYLTGYTFPKTNLVDLAAEIIKQVGGKA
jgi:hypothetical protein